MEKREQHQLLSKASIIIEKATSLLNGYVGGLTYNLKDERNAQGVDIPNRALARLDGALLEVQRVTSAIDDEARQEEYDRKYKEEVHARMLEEQAAEAEKDDKS